MAEIDRYEDLKPQDDEGQFANPANKTFPIATESDIRSSWRYINNPDNTTQYDNNEIESIKNRIKQAAMQHRIDLNLEN